MSTRALVDVSELRVMAGDATIVRDVSFSIPKGEVLALIGESGSGKTTIALALMGYARSGCRISGGAVQIAGVDVLSLNAAQLSGLRGRTVAYIAQSAAAAFNPSKTLLDQVIESALIHGVMSREAAEAKAIELFRALALPDPERIGQRYPHQVSGGQLQRLLAAMALITDPALVILDEPTTALDVTTQVEVLRAFKRVVREVGTTAVYVSHDLAVVAQMADRIMVLNRGEARETGTTEKVLEAPSDPYTQTLLAAARPSVRSSAITITPSERPLLEIRGLVAGYGAHVVLKDVDLALARGSALGVIGESGSGKSTLARVIAGLLSPVSGSIHFQGVPLAATIEGRTRDQLRRIQIVFQNADTALNPAHTVERILARPLELYHGMRGAGRRKRIAELLDRVRLPADLAARRCSELSGGQKQRINLARALAAEPDVILCDEVTSALDTVVASAILDLLAELRRELKVSYVFISHDISTVRALCDETVVLYSGRKVESGDRATLLVPPHHPYTDLLTASIPELRRGWLEQVGSPQAPPPIGPRADASGLCVFLNRCPVRMDGVCNTTPPPPASVPGKYLLCHRMGAS